MPLLRAPRGFVALLLWAPTATATTDHFESPPVHPVELSPDGTKLFVAHTADHRVVVFDVSGPGAPVRIAEIPVGLEPVTVRARTDGEIWVVNHVSDDVSVVDVGAENVVATVLAGDEPTDVVFAGSPERAFVCVSQEDRIRVWDPADLTAPPIDIPLDASHPRSLALSPDGSSLYVGVFGSGRRTTSVPIDSVEAGGGLPPPAIPMDPGLPPAPVTALIVRHDGTSWRDETGSSWDWAVPYLTYDHDVARIDVASATVAGYYTGVGTNLFNLAVDPVGGGLFVTNQEATNDVRFEPLVKGRFLRNRVTLLDPVTGIATPVHLNPHIDYDSPAGNAAERAQSLSIPLDVVVAGGGETLYVAAFGSGKVGVLDAGGAVTRRIPVGDGPAGLALDEANQRLFVLNRHASSLSVVDLADDSSIEIPLGFDPTPANVRAGRTIFYGGESSSAHGDVSCASCHVFGAVDDLAWDLGDPQGPFLPPPPGAEDDSLVGFHPMKGPMTTQTMKGLAGTEPLHWRGDRETLGDFNGAFVSLLGRGTTLSGSELQLFEDFTFSMILAPNPNLELDGSLPASIANGDPSVGQEHFYTTVEQGGGNCVSCHEQPSGNGPEVLAAIRVQALSTQDMTVPQLRTMYKKTRFKRNAPFTVRSYGTAHDGANGDLNPHQLTLGQGDGAHAGSLRALDPELDKRDIEAFLRCFDTGTHPVVGAQWTMDGTNEAAGIARVGTMVAIADAGAAGLIAKGRDPSGQTRGFAYAGAGSWTPDRVGEPATDLGFLLALAGPGTEITFTGVLPGTETRLGIDRDADGYYDRDELDWGSDPGDPNSTPPSSAAGGDAARSLVALRALGRNPASTAGRFALWLGRRGPAELRVHDVSGRVVRTLVDEPDHPAGGFEAVWDLRDGRGHRVSNGIYFVRFSGSGGSTVRRLAVVR
jgi:YVTN family beta-propeller protein